ncbi:PorV/PorQ family protein [candidate division WOR-3 bacterium]|uniref:PorV/PorQ family protein n=1 Tax=candidate division WOR-3 bacterium TaxID=2052148 RepID=A0A9D5K871_UNCW3|nr:PorV/PorQ family protein [candidate division WOR-3 bacterium]MBD3363879.1 PorV/PorQ family protein [candidate division WOR-3 bacterium]
MKKTLTVLLLIVSAAFAQFSGVTGTTAHPVLKIGFGPRAAAMGNAYVGMSTDITGLWWNPAGLNQLNTYEAILSHHEWFQGIRDEFVGLVWPQSPKNTYSFAVNFTSTVGIEHWDENNLPVGSTDSSVTYISAYEAMFVGAFTRQITPQLGIGVGFKGIYENLYQSSGFGGGADVGLHFQASPSLGLGAVVQNLGVVAYGSGVNLNPIQAQLGAALSLDFMSGLNLLADVRIPMDNNVSVHLGGEIWPMEMLAARVGFQTGPQSLFKTITELEESWTSDQAGLGALAGLTGGVGIVLDQYRIDYTLAPYGMLGLTHRIAVIAAFGERPRFGGVIVKVIDAETKQPLAATIELGGLVRATHETDPQGRWERKGLNSGTVEATASKDEYYPNSNSTEIEPGKTSELVIALSRIPPGGIEGQVTDVKTNEPLVATIFYEGPNEIEGEVKTDEQGNYTIPSLYRGEYALYAKPDHEKYFPQDADVTVDAGEKTTKDFALLREKVTIVFHNIQFETGEARLLPEFYDVLDHIGKILVDNPTIKVELGGHTDPRPIETPEFPDNMALSQGRVDAVRKYLIDKFNINEERLVAKGYGETKPIASNETEEGMAKNRRVEFKVLTGIEYYHEIRQTSPDRRRRGGDEDENETE